MPGKGQICRTKTKAIETSGAIQQLPQNLAVITNGKYQNALSLYPQGLAYLQSLPAGEEICFKGGILYFCGYPANAAKLKALCKDHQAENVDLPLLSVIYSIMLMQWQGSTDKEHWLRRNITIYIPDLAGCMGKSPHIGSKDLEAVQNKIDKLKNVVGIVKDPDNPNNECVLPLLYAIFDHTANTVKFSSPYMEWVILHLYRASIRRDKKGKPRCKSNGEPMMAPSHTYLVKSSIAKERNKHAVEIVVIVVKTIEQAGGPRKDKYGVLVPAQPHLKARTIVQRNVVLKQSLESAGCTADRNKILKRAFSKAWTLLRTQTNLQERYPGIQLPDPDNPQDIPTMQNLDKTFIFTHGGKQ